MSLSQPKQAIVNTKKISKHKRCNECKRIRPFYRNFQICCPCCNIKTILKPEQSGNKVIDDFIKYAQTNYVSGYGRLEFVPYDQFKNVEFIAEGGFSKIYKATWVDGPISLNKKRSAQNVIRDNNHTVALKKLNNSNNITSKELNEVLYV
jgi:hypothetical protein